MKREHFFSNPKDVVFYMARMNIYALVQGFAKGKRVLDWNGSEVAGVSLLSEVAGKLTVCTHSHLLAAELKQKFGRSKDIVIAHSDPMVDDLPKGAFDLIVITVPPKGHFVKATERAKTLLTPSGMLAIAIEDDLLFEDVDETQTSSRLALNNLFKNCEYLNVRASPFTLISSTEDGDFGNNEPGKQVSISINPRLDSPLEPLQTKSGMVQAAFCSDAPFEPLEPRTLSLMGVDIYSELVEKLDKTSAKFEASQTDLFFLEKRHDAAFTELLDLRSTAEACAKWEQAHQNECANHDKSRDQIEVLKAEAAESREKLQESQRQAAEAFDQVSNLERVLAEHRAELADNTAKIDALKAEAAESQEKLQESQRQAAEAFDQVSNLERVLAEHRAELANNTAKIDAFAKEALVQEALQVELAKLDASLSSAHAQIETFERQALEHKALHAELAELNEKASEEIQDLKSVQDALLREKSWIIQELEHLRTTHLNEIASRDALANELVRARSSLEQAALENETLRGEHVELERLRASLEHAVGDNDHLLAENDALTRERVWITQELETTRAELHNTEHKARMALDTIAQLRTTTHVTSIFEQRPQRGNSQIDAAKLEINNLTSQVEIARRHQDQQTKEAEKQAVVLRAKLKRSEANYKRLEELITSLPAVVRKSLGMSLPRKAANIAQISKIIGPFFDKAWYAEQYKDVRQSSLDPLTHYIVYGEPEGRDPHPKFSTEWYLESNLDVMEAGVNAFAHFIEMGQYEGRDPSPNHALSTFGGAFPTVVASDI